MIPHDFFVDSVNEQKLSSAMQYAMQRSTKKKRAESFPSSEQFFQKKLALNNQEDQIVVGLFQPIQQI